MITPLGHVFAELQAIVESLDAVVIENNYDTAMLDAGSYPQMLKNRISGPGGHLSNDESASLLRAAGCRRLQWAYRWESTAITRAADRSSRVNDLPVDETG